MRRTDYTDVRPIGSESAYLKLWSEPELLCSYGALRSAMPQCSVLVIQILLFVPALVTSQRELIPNSTSNVNSF